MVFFGAVGGFSPSIIKEVCNKAYEAEITYEALARRSENNT